MFDGKRGVHTNVPNSSARESVGLSSELPVAEQILIADMPNPESYTLPITEAQVSEWARRTAEVSTRLAQGGVVAEQQEKVRSVTATLKQVRLQQCMPLEQVAQALGIEPMRFCFFESGLLGAEELFEVVDKWLDKLGLDRVGDVEQLDHPMEGDNHEPDGTV